VSERDVTLRDGRTLHVYDEADPNGKPVVVHHGAPSAGRLFVRHVEDAQERGIRLIGYDRAGYGGSTPSPGRSIADVAPDVEDVLDSLGVDRFATWGISGGGPHALACAALLENRCVAAAALASPAPWGAEGLDWLEGMGEGNVAEFDAVLAGGEALEASLGRDAAEMLAGGADEMRKAILSVLSPVDQAALDAEFGEFLYETMREGIGERIDGWRDDNVAFVHAWGFEPADVSTPFLLLQGVHDLMVPPSHGRWLAARIPGVDARISESDGHLTLLKDGVPEVHEWLLERF
jgi:pimeloyl-ACP methyl ester carboxylesterase